MTDEQNKPVRSREDQIEALASQFGEEDTFSYVDDRDAAAQHILEAESRGAAEQRRKDAEGCRAVHQWRPAKGMAWHDCTKKQQDTEASLGYETRTLYTHPANVAAMEDRVRELEGVILHLLETEEITDPSKPRILDLAYTAFMSGACGKNPDDGGKCDWFNDTRPKIMRHIGNARAALKIVGAPS